MDLCTKKLGMQIELQRNNVYQGVELLLLVSMLFLLAIPKCLLIFKEIFITLVIIRLCMISKGKTCIIMNMIVLHNSLPTIHSIDYMQYMRVKQVLAHAGRWHLISCTLDLVAMATHSTHLVQET